MIKNFIVRSQFKSHFFSWFRAEQVEREKSNKNLMLNTTPAVSPETSKEDFKKRYANLMLNMLILTVFWVGGLTSSIINLVNSNVMIGLNLLVFSCIPLVILFQNQYLKWLAQGVYRDWDNRNKPNEKTMIDFIGAVYGDPAILVRFRLSK
ncbi:hypothetical protein [Aeromonas hydrophila]|jgi:hypothetical protein|uniref:hypothetical protein n=1 Tax=Aeromonas hydrophila TaxID=644 RepID=UPI0007609083|nr:hypothetical protein [Aeromonas hydrophila]KWR67313.1 hypothetical protein ATO50_14725 [Aeromonas hydrophila]HAU4929955.1 hypothetical protein [Aeromonas hydrophila]